MRAYEKVVMYRTADGALHSSEREAENHIQEVIMVRVGKAVREALIRGRDTVHLLVPITEAIISERAAIREALNMEVAFEGSDD